MTIQGQGKVVVIGSGLMGTGIAHAFAAAGHRTTVVDVNQAQLDKAAQSIRTILEDGERLGKISEEQLHGALRSLSFQAAPEAACREADLVIETVSENMDLKRKVFAQVDAVVPDHCVVASNTGALSITELAAGCRRPEAVIGMHFFNPVHKMKLVEIVRGLQTGDETIARAQAWSAAIGKTSIIVNEAPGLTTSRMAAMLGNEAMWMLQEGTASAEDIDTAMRLGLNHPMGPLELGDLTGWDTRLAVINYLHATLGEKFRPCPLITKMVKAGRHGRKTGWGVYRYENGKKVPGSGLSNGLWGGPDA
jgi:3-hydroxybutyryl-CoA dehydrogenase